MASNFVVVAEFLIAIHAKKYIATFDPANHNISGTVIVNDGQVIVDIDLSAQPALPLGFENCIAGGLKYHIHDLWGLPDNADRFGETDCGALYTDFHWDPWTACGPATGNDFCMKPNSPPDMFHCIPVGDYSPNYAVDPFSAEVGDWSAKYGSLILDSDYKISRTDSSFYEVNAAEVHGYSVVFHCNSEERAFCAQFVESTEDATLSKPAQTNAKSVLADFSSALDSESIIILYPNGDVFVDLDVTHKYIPDAMCERLRYGVFEPGNMKLSESNLGGACNEYVGAQYDPTHACLANSSSPYCSNGVLCDENNDSNYIYNCSFAQDRYSCAPGDLSGKFGLITDPANTPLSVEYIGRDSLIPPTDSLIGKVMVIQCENAGIDGYNPMHIACAPIEEYGANDGNKGRNVEEIIAFIAIGFGVAMFCAFMCYVVVRVKGYELRKTPNVKGRLIEEESINKSNNEEVVDSMNKRIL